MKATKRSVHKFGVVVRYNFTIERHASKVYTISMFEQFGKMIFEACAYKVEEVEKNRLYRTTHTDASRGEKWSRVFDVNILDEREQFDCECGMFAHMGDALWGCSEGDGLCWSN